MSLSNFLRPRTARQIAGRRGEDAACDYLRQRGLVLVERNFLCKGGEIDLIMQHGDVLVFVEVRLRTDRSHGGAAASVTPAKQRKLILAAQHYLQRYRMPPACRFDVIAIDGDETDWIRDAIAA